MKYLLVLIVVMIAIFIWRGNRVADKPSGRRGKAAAEDDAVDMIGCDLCGLHCPRGDLVVGRKGVYCCTQHQHEAEA